MKLRFLLLCTLLALLACACSTSSAPALDAGGADATTDGGFSFPAPNDAGVMLMTAPHRFGSAVPIPSPGDAGYLLTSNGPGVTPGWQPSTGITYPIDGGGISNGTVQSSALSPGTAGQVLMMDNGPSALWKVPLAVNVVTAYGAKCDGTTDDSSAFQAALNALSGTGTWLQVPPGSTCKIAATVDVPSSVVVTGYGATILSNIAGSNFYNATFYAEPGSILASTTLSGNIAAGATTLTVTSATGFAAGAIIQIAGASPNGNRVGFYNEIGAPSGSTITVDRPILRAYSSSDNVVVYSSRPHDIHVLGLTFTGVAARYNEWVACANCSQDDVQYNVSGGASVNMVSSYDNGGYHDYYNRVAVSMQKQDAGGGIDGLAFESCEGCGYVDSTVRGVNGVGLNIYDGIDIKVSNTDSIGNTSHGLQIGADGESLGSQDVHVIGGHFDYNGGSGIIVGSGSTETDIVHASAIGNTVDGLADDNTISTLRIDHFTATGNANGYVHAIGAAGVSVSDSDFSGNTTYDLDLGDSVSLSGIYISDSTAAGRIIDRSGYVKIRGLYLKSGTTSGQNLIEISGGQTDIAQSTILGTSDTQVIVDTGATVRVTDTILGPNGASGTEHCLYNNSGTLKIGANVDTTTCAHPVTGAYESDFQGSKLSDDGSGNTTLDTTAAASLKLCSGTCTNVQSGGTQTLVNEIVGHPIEAFVQSTQVAQLNAASGDYVAFGATPGSSGHVRCTSADDCVDSPGTLNVGTSGATLTQVGNATNNTEVLLVTKSAGPIVASVGGTQVSKLSIASDDFTAYGVTPGSNGHVRCNGGDDCVDSPGALDIGATGATGVTVGNQSTTTTTNIDAVTSVNFNVGVSTPISITGSLIEPSAFGGTGVGAAAVPFGAAYLGASTTSGLGYTEFAAATGTHNSQAGVTFYSADQEEISTYSAKGFQSYTLPIHTGVFTRCTAVGRVVTAGSGGSCSFWATGVHGAPDSTYSCTIENTGWQTTSGSFSSYNNPTYLRCDCSGGACTYGSTPTNPLLTYSGTTSGATVTVKWTVYNDSCTTPPVLDVTSSCQFVEN